MKQLSIFTEGVLVALAMSCLNAAEADDRTKYSQALKEITDTADKICQSAPLQQTSQGLSLTGDAQAKLDGVLGKIADLGISGSGAFNSANSYGVLQKDLIQAIQVGNSCKLEVFKALEKDLIQKPESLPPSQKVEPQSQSGSKPPQPSSETDDAPPRPGLPARYQRNSSGLIQMGENNWNNFPEDLQDARDSCLNRLFLDGTHEDNFTPDPSNPRSYKFFRGALAVRLTRNSQSDEINSITMRVIPHKNKTDRELDYNRVFKFSCYIRNGNAISSSEDEWP